MSYRQPVLQVSRNRWVTKKNHIEPKTKGARYDDALTPSVNWPSELLACNGNENYNDENGTNQDNGCFEHNDAVKIVTGLATQIGSTVLYLIFSCP